MNKYSFARVAACTPLVKPGDVAYNYSQILQHIKKGQNHGVEVMVFPELSLSGYTCGDLFRQTLLLDEVEKYLIILSEDMVGSGMMIVVGAPLRHGNALYNCAVFIADGEILGVIPKIYLPNTNEFYEKRWFASGRGIETDVIWIVGEEYSFGTNMLFSHLGVKYGAEICEDLWAPIPPSSNAAMAGADVIVNLSATNELIGKHDYLISLIKQQSARCRAGYVYASAGVGESSTDLVYTGNAIIAEDGAILGESPRFTGEAVTTIRDIDIERLRAERRNSSSYIDNSLAASLNYIVTTSECDPDSILKVNELKRYVDPHPFVPSDTAGLDEHCKEIISIQAAGLMQRLRATGCKQMVVGLSGGLDSTLAILVTHKAFESLGLDLKGLHAITMPGFGTTDRTYRNALALIDCLGVSGHQISIAPSVRQHFIDIDHDINVHDVTYENSQARERTQILMDYANKVGGMVLGTGDLSELALGWCTYNGDHMSMYGVNASVPKTLVKHLVNWFAMTTPDEDLHACLLDIVDTPISPELIPAAKDGTIKQKTEDLVGPYELHDFFLYQFLRFGFTPEKIEYLARKAFDGTYSKKVIRHWLTTFLRRFFSQQFKRSCMPDGPKVGSVCLSPRGDWRMPSDVSAKMWLDSLS